jgi:CDK inhibitor PHO81
LGDLLLGLQVFEKGESSCCKFAHAIWRADGTIFDATLDVQIINSLASHRPASEASLLAVGIRPSPTRIESTSLNPLDASSPTATPTLGPGRSTSSTTLTSSTPFLLSPALHAQNPSLGNHLNLDAGVQSIDLEPLPPGAEPPAPGESASGGVNGVARGRDRERDESFKAHRAVFFFKLGRELEKVSNRWRLSRTLPRTCH